MVERVYAHLGTVRHRAEVVEYRVEQFQAILQDHLAGFEAHSEAVDFTAVSERGLSR